MRKLLTVLLLLLIPVGWFLIEDKISFGFYAFVMVCFAAGVAGDCEGGGSSGRSRAMDREEEDFGEYNRKYNCLNRDDPFNMWHR